jgi:hypothetical protein
MRQQMQHMSGNGLSVQSVRYNPHLMTAAMNPSTASMAFVSNPWLLGMEYKHKSLTLEMTSELSFITI